MRLGSVELNAAALGGREPAGRHRRGADRAGRHPALWLRHRRQRPGAELLSRLAQLTHADVAASMTAPARARGGDWVLEAVSGSVRRRRCPAYNGLLAPRPARTSKTGRARRATTRTPGDRRSALRDQQHRHHRRDQCGRYLRPDFPGFSGRAISTTRRAGPGSNFFELSAIDLANNFKLKSLVFNALDFQAGLASSMYMTAYDGGFNATPLQQID